MVRILLANQWARFAKRICASVFANTGEQIRHVKSSVLLAYLPGGRICGVKPNFCKELFLKISCTHVPKLFTHECSHGPAGSICATRPDRSSGPAAGLRGGGDVAAPPIGRPSDRSISAQSRLQIRERCWRRRRSQRRRQQLPLLSNAPRSDAGVLGPPWTTKAPPGARRPVRWHPPRAAAVAACAATASSGAAWLRAGLAGAAPERYSSFY